MLGTKIIWNGIVCMVVCCRGDSTWCVVAVSIQLGGVLFSTRGESDIKRKPTHPSQEMGWHSGSLRKEWSLSVYCLSM